jgi:hypothetical protein
LFQSNVINKGKNQLNTMAIDEPTLIKKQKELQIKIDNLLQAVESGINVETVTPRVRELEKEKQKITVELGRINRSKMQDDNSVKEIASQVSKTVLEFQNSFETLSIIQKKHLIRRFIHRIIVDRDAGKVRGYIRVIPKLEHLINRCSLCK